VASIDIRAVARTISVVENGRDGADEIVRNAYRAAARRVPVIGITGPPGAGKSTLMDRLAPHWAGQGKKIAILAVDPSSPFTGGALLGDRFRMDGAASHSNIFVRSLASRGEAGGLSKTTTDIATVLGVLGFDRVLIETAGAGQTDIAIGMVADVVIVMAVPGFGDHVQAAKAGILEIGDIYVVNKSDLPEAATLAHHLESNLDLVYPGSAGRNIPLTAQTFLCGNEKQHRRHGNPAGNEEFWRPPVLPTSAREGTGIEQLATLTDDFLAWSRKTQRYDDRLAERLKFQILSSMRNRLADLCIDAAGKRGVGLDSLAGEVALGNASPRESADRLIEWLVQKDG
jgi:LAO/AO transport system kinase